MNRKERHQAADALINWLRTQDIAPHEAVPILAETMVIAVISESGAHEEKDSIKHVTEGVGIAANMVKAMWASLRKEAGEAS